MLTEITGEVNELQSFLPTHSDRLKTKRRNRLIFQAFPLICLQHYSPELLHGNLVIAISDFETMLPHQFDHSLLQVAERGGDVGWRNFVENRENSR